MSAKSGLTIAKSGPATIVSGNNITYTITVGNDGPSNAVSAVIADVIPASIQNPSWTSTVQGSATILSGGSGTGSSVQTTANIPAGAGNKVILTITGKVNPALNGSITNTATATPTESNSPAPQSQVTTTANRTPALTITKNGPAALLAGANITYVVEITNGSLSDAVNAAISDAVPGQVSNVTWSAVATGTAVINSGASGSGSNVALNASIPAGSGNKVTVTISGKVSGAFNGTLTNQATVTPAESGTTATSSSVSTAISKIPVLAIQKTGPATISAGQVVTYTIRVNNTSTANANAAVITDTVAANIQNVTWTATASNGALISAGATGAGNNISVTADIPGAAMAEAVITVTGTLDASATGTVSNIATVTPAEAGAVVKRSGAVVTNISKTPNVSLIKTGPATINAGQTITYVIEAVNSGPSNADGIAISDVISPVLTNVSWTAVANGTSSVTTASGTGDVNVTGNLLAGIGNSIRITVTGTVPASQLNTTISNTATATPAETGVAVSSNMVETIISNRSGLVMSKSAPPTMNAGEIIHYTLTVTNNGPSNAVGALIQDNVAADIANVSWTAEASGDAAITTGTSGTGNQVSVTADIPAGNSSTVVVHITGTLIASYTNSSVLNTATVTPAETGNPVVNSNDAVTTVTRQSNLRISKTGPGSLSAGQVATYVLTVDNQGPQ
ncbi:DUF11 domain-containing protein [Chitinophaga sedimenti]|uniref:beta strand repeat-containing protein n=1 Tax=Chitinophaga sedimenti TaxID=2033606 RepID=UPI00200478B5|nr:DUF11 domain-containing protein [Chitinophaga sedimenti]MCK7555992.1 DUF11 domain-containing protein [Chitinophaga sedimenti]